MANNVVNLFGVRTRAAEQSELGVEKSEHEKVQLSLGFSAPHCLMLLMVADIEKPEIFLRFASAVQSRLILDMRIAPRLDFIGFNRAQSFNVFESLSIDYKDMLGRAAIKSYEESSNATQVLWESLGSVLDSIEVRNHPVLLFFDNLSFLHQCRTAMSSMYEVIVLNYENIHSTAVDEPLRM